MLLAIFIIVILSIIIHNIYILRNRKRSILSFFNIIYVCTTFRRINLFNSFQGQSRNGAFISYYSAADIKFPSCIRFISDTSTRDEAFSSEDDTDTDTELSSIDNLFL
jgi:hypothetical protein